MANDITFEVRFLKAENVTSADGTGGPSENCLGLLAIDGTRNTQ